MGRQSCNELNRKRSPPLQFKALQAGGCRWAGRPAEAAAQQLLQARLSTVLAWLCPNSYGQ